MTAGAPAAAAGSPYLDYGARLFDPRTAAWLSQDPMAEKYYSISPYAYCANNSVNAIDIDGRIPVWLISAGLEYGFQVCHNYKEGYRGFDLLVGQIDFVDVALSAVVPTGKFKIAKSFILETAKVGFSYSLTNGGEVDKDYISVFEKALVSTITDAAIDGAIAKSNKAVESTTKNLEKASYNARHTANIANNRPSSTKRAKSAENAAATAQIARKQQVRAKMVNSVLVSSPETTKKVVGEIMEDFYSEYDENKEFKITVPLFGK